MKASLIFVYVMASWSWYNALKDYGTMAILIPMTCALMLAYVLFKN